MNSHFYASPVCINMPVYPWHRNATAVCIYSLAEFDDIFENSNFKGYKENIPEPRPGTVRTFIFLSHFILLSVHCNCNQGCSSSVLTQHFIVHLTWDGTFNMT